MEFLKNIEWTPLNIMKALVVFLLALVAFSLLSRFLSPVTEMVLRNSDGVSMSYPAGAPAYDGGGYDTDDSYNYVEEAADEKGGNIRLSSTNIGIPTPDPRGSVGGDAEEYEVVRYSASIEAQDSEPICNKLVGLKDLDYVVFENANEYDRGCHYTFKVEHEKVAEVLAEVESLNPKNLSENTYTVKPWLDDFTSETEILEKKLSAINETLENAIKSYDEIALLATRTQDVESLAKIIDSKINTIERLSEQRIDITAQLERLSRGKAEQLDKLDYTYFDVDVYENKFVDGESIKDSWKLAVKGLVNDINSTLQGVSVNLIAILFLVAQYVLYFFILLFIAKLLWRSTLNIWKK